MANTPARLLADGIAQLQLAITDAQQDQLLAYLELLQKWNKAYNLTAVRDSRAMVTRHLLDSLAILPYLDETPLVDVGTGAGIPGVMLAICRPQQAFCLLDSNGKKTRFVTQAKLELELANVEVVQKRVEQYRSSFGQVCCRAYAALPDILKSCRHLLADDGRILAMKADKEREQQLPGWRQTVHPLQVPGLNEPRQLWVLTPLGETA